MREYVFRYQLTRSAYDAVQYAIRIGRLPRPDTFSCVDCGNPAEEYDHRDYRKKLDVQPVCIKCNAARGPGLPWSIRPDWSRKASFFKKHDPWADADSAADLVSMDEVY